MFRLQANPTFSAPVRITVPGADEPATVQFTFRHKGRKALAQFRNRIEAEKLDDVDVLMEVVADWSEDIKNPDGVPVPFTREALQELIDAYHNATREIWDGYLLALGEARAGN